jgi:selenide,water dikinase
LSGYLAQGCFPGGTQRNWISYGNKIGAVTDEQRYILADPQTSGGLMVAVSEDETEAFEAYMNRSGLPAQAFGRLIKRTDATLIQVV